MIGWEEIIFPQEKNQPYLLFLFHFLLSQCMGLGNRTYKIKYMGLENRMYKINMLIHIISIDYLIYTIDNS